MWVVIRVLYAYFQSYSDLRGYSDKGGGGGVRVVIHVLYAYCQSYYGFQSGQLTKHGTTGHHSNYYTTICVIIVVIFIFRENISILMNNSRGLMAALKALQLCALHFCFTAYYVRI